MAEYIKTIGYFMVLTAFVGIIAENKFKRDINFVMGIILLLMIFAPIENIIDEISDLKVNLSQTQSAEDNGSMQLQQQILKKGMVNALEQNIAQNTQAERVVVNLNSNGDSVESVILYGRNCTQQDVEKTAEICGISDNEKIQLIGG